MWIIVVNKNMTSHTLSVYINNQMRHPFYFIVKIYTRTTERERWGSESIGPRTRVTAGAPLLPCATLTFPLSLSLLILLFRLPRALCRAEETTARMEKKRREATWKVGACFLLNTLWFTSGSLTLCICMCVWTMPKALLLLLLSSVAP